MTTKDQCVNITWTDPNNPKQQAHCTWTPDNTGGVCANQYASGKCSDWNQEQYCKSHGCTWVGS
eukprot:3225762-Prymnesium_polylepis.1